MKSDSGVKCRKRHLAYGARFCCVLNGSSMQFSRKKNLVFFSLHCFPAVYAAFATRRGRVVPKVASIEWGYLSANTALPTTDPLILMSTEYTAAPRFALFTGRL